MTTTIQLKPFHETKVSSWYFFYRKINWLWWLQRTPQFALAIPAAYGVAAFSSIDNKLPELIAAIAGIAFESTYIGTIALSDQMTEDDVIGKRIWLGLNISAVLASALFSTLYFAGGKYSYITPESITHGALLPILNFFYGFLLHWISIKSFQEQREVENATKEHCEYCGIGRANRNAIISHYRYCDRKLAGYSKKYNTDGAQLL